MQRDRPAGRGLERKGNDGWETRNTQYGLGIDVLCLDSDGQAETFAGNNFATMFP